MRGLAYVALAILVTGCTLPSSTPGDPTPTPPAPVVSPTSIATPALPPPAPATPTGSTPEPETNATEPEAPIPTPPTTDPAPEPTPPGPPTATTPPIEPTAPPSTTDTTTGSSGSSSSGGSTSSPPPAGSSVPLFTIEPGLDAAGGSFLRSWSRDADGRGFAADIRAVPGATLAIDSLARVATEATPIAVEMRGPAITDPKVLEAKLFLKNGTAIVATLDLLVAQPTATASLAPRTTYEVGWRYTLAQDAAAPVTVALQLVASA